MRRSAAFACAFFMSGILTLYLGKTRVNMADAELLFVFLGVPLLVSGLCFFLFCLRRTDPGKRKRGMLIGCFLLAFVLGGGRFLLAASAVDPLIKKEGLHAVVQGQVLSVQKKAESCQLLIQRNRGNVLLTLWLSEAELVQTMPGLKGAWDLTGRKITVKGTVELPSPKRNPGGFDYRLYLRSKNVQVLLLSEAENLKIGAVESFCAHEMARLKDGFSEKISARMGIRQCALIKGMLFGDKSDLEGAVYEAFQRNGVAHILSVSGLHVNLLYLYIDRLLAKGSKCRRSALVSVALLFYAGLSEFSPSVMRAVLMILMRIVGKLLLKRNDMTSSIFISGVVLLTWNPYYLFHTGFQLSYLAVLSLAVVLPFADSLLCRLAWKSRKEWLIGMGRPVLPLVVIQLSMAPATAYLFNCFSLTAFFLNPPVIALSGMLIPLGMVLLLLSALPVDLGAIFWVLAAASELLTQAILWLNAFVTELGFGVYTVVSPPMGVFLLCTGFLFLGTSEGYFLLKRRGRRGHQAGILVTLLVLSSVVPWICGEAAFPHPLSRKTHAFVFVDVGQGDCLHIRTPLGKNILIDGGGSPTKNVGKKILLPYLLKNGVNKIDLAVVTHLHDDHFKGIQELSCYLPVEKLGVYEATALQPEKLALGEAFANKNQQRIPGIKEHDRELLFLSKGDRLAIERGIWIDVLAPEAQSPEVYEDMLVKEQDENATSLLLKVSYEGLTVLMTGDMGFSGENAVKAAPLQAHILKVGHHGSKYSTAEWFLRAVNPCVAIFQVGKNNYGHPAVGVIELISRYGILTKRNDLDGAVFVDRKKSGEIAVRSAIE